MDTADARRSRPTPPDAIRAVPSRADADRRRGLPPVRSRPEGVAARRRRRQGRAAAGGAGAGHAACTWCRSTCRAVARLKLQPRFERVDDRRRPPRRPARLRRAADARRPVPRSRPNHELERAFQSERSRRGIVAVRRIAIDGRTLAHEFLERRHAARAAASRADAEALLPGDGDRARDVRRRALMSDRPRDVPEEAYRRFRADLRARKEQNLEDAAPSELALHEEKLKVVARVGCRAWHGGPARPTRRRPAARRQR